MCKRTHRVSFFQNLISLQSKNIPIKAIVIFFLLLGSFPYTTLRASDWPMWRYDSARSAASGEQLAEKLYLQWERKLPVPKPAWPPHQYKLQFDLSYEPVVMGNKFYVPSMVNDSVMAYDIDTGCEVWRFYADAPVRFAPIAWKNKLYFVSDDGFVYCLDAETAKLVWKFHAAPVEQKILGNKRLISTWPVRGAPVLQNGRIYFAAGIWPFMGTFIYCLNAETGDVIWCNSGTGSAYIKQPHDSSAFAGPAPQGYLAITGSKLLIPGRTIPACFDSKTGRFLYYRIADKAFGKYVGGYDVKATKDYFINNGVLYNLADGNGIGRISADVLIKDAAIGRDKHNNPAAFTLSSKPKGIWKANLATKLKRIYLKAGSRIYATTDDHTIVAVDIPNSNQQAKILWQHKAKDKVWNMLAANGKLFVVGKNGTIYCFGPDKTKPIIHNLSYKPLPLAPPQVKQQVKEILNKTNVRDGYCILLGLDKDHLLTELIEQSKLHIITLDPNTEKVIAMRKKLDDAGYYGTRATVLAGNITSLQLPPYFANLVIAQDIDTTGSGNGQNFAKQLFHSLRPYGGTACIKASLPKQIAFAKDVEQANLLSSKVDMWGDFILLKRCGPLPDSDDWTHQYGNIANTVCSKDKLVKLPLGLLWFDQPAGFGDVLPRHGHGPPEQVVAGRLFIEGIDSLSARDVYTGRVLWKRDFPNLNNFNVYYDKTYKLDPFDKSYNQVHIPGANARGTNFVATAYEVYLIQGKDCCVLDAATGKEIRRFSAPESADSKKTMWGYVGIYKDYLIGTSGFAEFSKLLKQTTEGTNEKGKKKKNKWLHFYDKLAGQTLFVMNRHTGDLIWKTDANLGFIHNAIAVGKNKIFCLDKLHPYVEAQFGNSISKTKNNYRLMTIDIESGEILWQKNENVFGTWLGYSEKHNILLQADRPSNDMIWEPGKRMITYNTEDGKIIWDKKINYRGPCIIHNDSIITQVKNSFRGDIACAYSLLTGEQKMRHDPITDKPVPWQYSRNYGCNTAIASEHILTFRSAAAGFFDLANNGGTGNFGGFKSGCTSNLVPANGVLNAPDYTQTCTCSYQNQSSLAMVHMPDVETWTFNIIQETNEPLQRIGINFGAPGDRLADNGTLWLDYPSEGGRSPDVSVIIEPQNPKWYRKHSSFIKAGLMKWVTASGGRGVRNVKIPLKNPQPRTYTVRLFFAEPDAKIIGQRVFNIALQGKTVLKNFDILSETKTPNISLVKEFKEIKAADSISLTLTPMESIDANFNETIISGIEIIHHKPEKNIADVD